MAYLTQRLIGRLPLGAAVTTLFGLLLLGCATAKPDWNSRIGSYTYDQSVIELGPPDKSANLKDGTLVAEWLTHRGSSYAQAYPYYYSPYWYGPYTYSSTPDYFLRLIFGPDGRLQSWKRFYK